MEKITYTAPPFLQRKELNKNDVQLQKGKVKLTLEQATKVKRVSRGIGLLFLKLGVDGVGGQRHAPAALPPGKRSSTHRIGGCVGLRAVLDGCGISRPHRDSIPRSPSP